MSRSVICILTSTSFGFPMVGLKPGDMMIFAQDPGRRATVADDLRIEYEDKPPAGRRAWRRSRIVSN